jgi:hypothetical protein
MERQILVGRVRVCRLHRTAIDGIVRDAIAESFSQVNTELGRKDEIWLYENNKPKVLMQ